MVGAVLFPRTVGDRWLGAEDLSDGRRLIDPVPVAVVCVKRGVLEI